MEIEQWVILARQGDRQAYIKLFGQYEEAIYRTAYVYVKNEQDALDIVQETAYRSFKTIAGLKEPQFFKTWLIRIAISCSIDVLRRRKRTVALHSDRVRDGTVAEPDIPLSVSLMSWIDCSDEDEKSVIMLRFYHDCTIRETAETLDMPLGTAKTVLYRALKKLRKLAREGDEG